MLVTASLWRVYILSDGSYWIYDREKRKKAEIHELDREWRQRASMHKLISSRLRSEFKGLRLGYRGKSRRIELGDRLEMNQTIPSQHGRPSLPSWELPWGPMKADHCEIWRNQCQPTNVSWMSLDSSLRQQARIECGERSEFEGADMRNWFNYIGPPRLSFSKKGKHRRGHFSESD